MNRIYEGAGDMETKVGFGHDRPLTPEERKSRIAMLSASLLTLTAISCGSLGLWRLGADLAWAGNFVIQDGLLSHWQVWAGAAIGMQYTSWWLVRYAGMQRVATVEMNPRALDGSAPRK